MTNVLVCGWYGDDGNGIGNLGDDLFIRAFRALFPTLTLIFTASITADKLADVDAVFFGGGSFLGGAPSIAINAIPILKTKKLFYIGVGVESYIHPLHLELMSCAKLIATRTERQVERLLEINSRSFYLPDLVYSLVPNIFAKTKIAKSVLIIPNVNVVPKVSDPHWKHAAWSYFKSEFVQFLDWLISNQYNLSFFSMCHAAQIEDDWASAELIGHMKHRSSNLLLQDRPQTIDEVVSLISQYELVITQRFHGIVFSDIARVPHITIHHHDKLKQWGSNHISYYNGSKQAFIDAMMAQLQPPCIIDPAVFLAFSTEVLNLIGG